MSILRKRSAAHKAYIPGNARDNQYILAEFNLTDEVLKSVSQFSHISTEQNYQAIYQTMSDTLFKLSEKYELTNTVLIANDKLPRVRFNQELHQWQTNQQILFFYNPNYHEIKKSFFDENYRARKISLLFLASGGDIRFNAASFHTKIRHLLAEFKQQLLPNQLELRLRDHQHLTYDLFAREKGQTENQVHKLRSIKTRYLHQHVELPEITSALTYAIANIPVNDRLKALVDIDLTSNDPYNPLYTYIAEAFTHAAKRFNLNNGAIIANGLVPIVRNSINEQVSSLGELQMLGYNQDKTNCGIICKWNAEELVDSIQLIFVATKANLTEHGYGRFLNHIEKCLGLVAETLSLAPHKDEMIIRFHQHIAYNS